MTRADLVEVAFEADRVWCRLHGWDAMARRTWANLTTEQRAAWIERGPAQPERAALYSAIMGVVDAQPASDPK